MQIIESLIVENFGFLLFIAVGIFSIVYYRKSKDERFRKTVHYSMKITFTQAEYDSYKEQAESALNNTTISFSGKGIDNMSEKMNLYYCTISVGNQIIRRGKFSISDVGEV